MAGAPQSSPVPGAQTAWDDAETQAFLKAKRTAARIFVGVVIVFTIGAITVGSVRGAHADRLAKHGVHTTGVVEWLHDEACKYAKSPPSFASGIRFTANGKSQVHRFEAQCGRGLFEGAVVPIAYDRSDPADFSVDGHVENNPALDALGIFGGAAAFAAAILAVGFTFERHGRKSVLRQTPWVTTTLLFVDLDVKGRGAAARGTVLTTPGGPQVFRCVDPTNRVVAEPAVQTLEVAGSEGARRALRRPGGRRILFVTSHVSEKVAAEIWEKWQRRSAQASHVPDGSAPEGDPGGSISGTR